MRNRRRARIGPGALDILEESFRLARRAPARAWAAYVIGTFPFVLGLLYFWMDMSKSGRAGTRLPEAALGLAVLFVWMKTWQTAYAWALWDELAGNAGGRWTVRRLLRVAAHQAIVQSWGLVVLPVALAIMLPFGWVYAFYQNVTVLDRGYSGGTGPLMGKAAKLAWAWPGQNHILIWALSPYLVVFAAGTYLAMIPIAQAISPVWTESVFGFYAVLYAIGVLPLCPFGVAAALNIATALWAVPGLLHMLFGVQTPFVQNPMALFNSTFFAVVCGLTFCCLDPLMKCAYVLRCFYAESIETGEDLRAELRRLSNRAAVLALGGWLAFLSSSGVARAEDAAVVLTPAGISTEALDMAIARELEHSQYDWRSPIDTSDLDEPWLLKKLHWLTDRIVEAWKWFADEWRRFWDRLDLGSDRGGGGGLFGLFAGGAAVPMLYILLFLLIGLLVFLVYRDRRWRSQLQPAIALAVGAARPDLDDEATTADRLPEEGWLALARESAERGDFRLALRAAFLAGLALLSRQNFVAIGRFKTNADYGRELERRVHARPRLTACFGRQVQLFEPVWYGTHEATPAEFEAALTNQAALARAAVDTPEAGEGRP